MNKYYSLTRTLIVFLTCLLISLSTVATAGTIVCGIDVQVSNQSESESDAQETEDDDEDEEDEEPECD